MSLIDANPSKRLFDAVAATSADERRALAEHIQAAVLDTIDDAPPLVSAWWIELRAYLARAGLDDEPLWRVAAQLEGDALDAAILDIGRVGASFRGSKLNAVMLSAGYLLSVASANENLRRATEPPILN